MECTERDWSSLPADLLDKILQSLNSTITDRCRLRSVCTTWRTSLTSLNPLDLFPVEIPLPPPAASCTNNKNGLLSQSAFYLISRNRGTETNSSDFWLTRVGENSPNKWSLQNPMSYNTCFKPLPDVKAKVSFLDLNVLEVTRSYSLLFNGDGHGDDDLYYKLTSLPGVWNRIPKKKPTIIKTIMFPKNGATNKQGSFSLLNLYSDGDLGLWKSGAEEWITVPKQQGSRFADAIVYEDEFYVTDMKGELKVINPATFETRDVITTWISVGDGKYVYLVESLGKLYLVNKDLIPTVLRTMSYRLLEQPSCLGVWVLGVGVSGSRTWLPTWSLNDRVFFLSEYVTFSVSAHELGWETGNLIMFNTEGFKGHIDYYGGTPPRYYNQQTYESVVQLSSRQSGIFTVKQDGITSIFGHDPLPQQFNIFWPVPPWLDNDSSSIPT